MRGPKISFITVSFNSGKTILETILSVNNQNLKGIEHIFDRMLLIVINYSLIWSRN